MPGYTDTDVVQGIRYYYRIQAINACGTSIYSFCANATLIPPPAKPLNAVAVERVTGSTWLERILGADSYSILRTTNVDCTTGLSASEPRVARPTRITQPWRGRIIITRLSASIFAGRVWQVIVSPPHDFPCPLPLFSGT